MSTAIFDYSRIRSGLFPLMLLALSCWGCEPAAPPAAAPPIAPPPAIGPTTETPAVAKLETSAAKSEGTTTDGKHRKLVVAMASDLRFVAVELQKEFEKQSPDIKLEPTFGSSGELFAQISNQAPFDVFLSADFQYPEQLAEQGHTKKDSLFRYAIGHIVLWVRVDSPLPVEEQGAEILRDPRVKKFAIANPKLAPYGRAAEAALKKLGVFDEVQSKLVVGKNVSQAATFAESGAADAAVIGMSFATAPEFASKGKYWRFPTDAYPQIDQGGVILEQSKDPAAAKKFCDFLQSPAAQEILKKYGFGLPK